MEFIDFMQEPFIALIPVLIALGWFIKSTTLIRDELIPISLGVIGILIAAWWQGFSPESCMQGVIAASISVYGNQNLKQLKKME